MSNDTLRRRMLLAYSAPSFSEQLMMAPLWGIMPVLYVQHTNVSLAAVGLVFTLSRFSDAITDPVIGFLSDATRSRFGPRKPWIAAGGLIALIAVLSFYVPPSDAGWPYFFVWSSLLFLGWTMMVIPYNAWATELTRDYHQRSRLFAYRNWVGGAGGLVFVASPLLLYRWTGSSEYTLELMRSVAIGIAFLIPIGLIVALVLVPRGAVVTTIERPSVKGIFDSLRGNRIMWLFVTITLIGGVSQGLLVSLQFLYVSTYMGLGSYLPFIGIGQSLVFLTSIPVWLGVVKRFGKHLPWAASSFALAVLAPIVFLLEPGEQSLVPIAALSVVSGFFAANLAVSPQSMLTDIIDYGTLKTGVNRAGNYFSFLTLLSKATTALGGGLGLTLVGLFGYDPKIVDNDPFAILGLLIVMGCVPALFGLINGALILKYPLNEKRQAVIRKRLEQLAERQEQSA